MLGVKEFTDLKQKVYLEGAYSYIDTLLFSFTYFGGKFFLDYLIFRGKNRTLFSFLKKVNFNTS